MNLLISIVIAVLFGTGAYMLLKPDLFRVVIGLTMISNAATLTLVASGIRSGQAPIRPFVEGTRVADPLAQAMTLTAVIIGFAVTALLLAMAYRVYTTHRSVDLDDLARSERSTEETLELGPEVERHREVEPEPEVQPEPQEART